MIRALVVTVIAAVLLAVWLEPRAVLGVTLLVFLAHRGRRLVRAEVKRREVDHY